jgi:AcrR family transcriptional regulator
VTAAATSRARSAPPHAKASRAEWIAAGRSALTEQPIEQLKVLGLADRLGVARSSFYWYFADRQGFLDALLDEWRGNTRSIVERAARDAPTITSACLGVFECWADPALFDETLDRAVREWGRRDPEVGPTVRAADAERVDAVAAMFRRHGYAPTDAAVRARLLYHSQVGYQTVEVREPLETRFGLLPSYLLAMTGVTAADHELAGFEAFVRGLPGRPTSTADG